VREVCECIASEWVGAMCVSDTHTHPPHPHTHTHQKCEDVRGAWVCGWVRVCWGSVWGVCELGASVCGVCECIASEWVGAMCVSDTHTHTPHPHTHTHQKCEDVRGAWVCGWVRVCWGSVWGVCELGASVCGVCECIASE